jgi:hypothetical protein
MSIFSKWLSLIKGSILGNLLTGWVLSAKFTRALPVFYAIALTFNTVFTVRSTVLANTTFCDNKQVMIRI